MLEFRGSSLYFNVKDKTRGLPKTVVEWLVLARCKFMYGVTDVYSLLQAAGNLSSVVYKLTRSEPEELRTCLISHLVPTET